MNNIDRQKWCDKKKWILSEKNCEDISGEMEYCDYCEFNGGIFNKCTLTQKERESKCLCATAYNRMIRARKS